MKCIQIQLLCVTALLSVILFIISMLAATGPSHGRCTYSITNNFTAVNGLEKRIEVLEEKLKPHPYQSRYGRIGVQRDVCEQLEHLTKWCADLETGVSETRSQLDKDERHLFEFTPAPTWDKNCNPVVKEIWIHPPNIPLWKLGKLFADVTNRLEKLEQSKER